jgi:hypothetical protein
MEHRGKFYLHIYAGVTYMLRFYTIKCVQIFVNDAIMTVTKPPAYISILHTLPTTIMIDGHKTPCVHFCPPYTTYYNNERRTQNPLHTMLFSIHYILQLFTDLEYNFYITVIT